MIRPLRNPVTPDLRSVNNTLNKEWQLFQQTLDQEQQKREVIYKKSLRQRFSKKKDRKIGPIWRVDAKAGQPLGIEDIKTSVEDARVYWESKPRLAHGKAQKGFHAFCNTLNAHSNLMKLLPQQNQYLSVFCGVTTTLIKVSTLLSLNGHVIYSLGVKYEPSLNQAWVDRIGLSRVSREIVRYQMIYPARISST